MNTSQLSLTLETKPVSAAPTDVDENVSVALIEALARVWSRIRANHPEVPGVVLLAAPARRGRLNVLGHFAALRWTHRQTTGTRLHEVVVVAEHLDRPAEDVLETLLHEAAHAANFEAGIRDCSGSQYHNRHFKAAAERLGLNVVRVPNYGFAFTTLPQAVAETYAPETEGLRQVLIHRRRPVNGPAPPGPGPDDDGGEGPRSRSRKATCSCPFIIRVSQITISSTVIRCETCGEPFRLA